MPAPESRLSLCLRKRGGPLGTGAGSRNGPPGIDWLSNITPRPYRFVRDIHIATIWMSSQGDRAEPWLRDMARCFRNTEG